MNSVSFVNAQTGCAVGGSGTILKSVDGRTSWTPQASGVTVDLKSVTFIDAQTGWAVGGGGAILRYVSAYPARAVLPFLSKSYSGGW